MSVSGSCIKSQMGVKRLRSCSELRLRSRVSNQKYLLCCGDARDVLHLAVSALRDEDIAALNPSLNAAIRSWLNSSRDCGGPGGINSIASGTVKANS